MESQPTDRLSGAAGDFFALCVNRQLIPEEALRLSFELAVAGARMTGLSKTDAQKMFAELWDA